MIVDMYLEPLELRLICLKNIYYLIRLHELHFKVHEYCLIFLVNELVLVLAPFFQEGIFEESTPKYDDHVIVKELRPQIYAILVLVEVLKLVLQHLVIEVMVENSRHTLVSKTDVVDALLKDPNFLGENGTFKFRSFSWEGDRDFEVADIAV